jgi:hypothetical protein
VSGRRVAGDATSTSLGLVGATSGVVQISLHEPTVDGVIFMRHPRNIEVSLEDPEGFIRTIEPSNAS